jgi:hypothetical protein
MASRSTGGNGAWWRVRTWLEGIDASLLGFCLASIGVVACVFAGPALMVALKDGEIQAPGEPENVVTEQRLAEVFEIEAEVSVTSRGPRIAPIRARHDGDERGGDGDEAERPGEVIAE